MANPPGCEFKHRTTWKYFLTTESCSLDQTGINENYRV